ncbi:MAG TPA: PD-(D/E)XK nuclease family protein, partial [Candidatus Limnocylindrales bacterium]|nr:PD-(D/E)XK nuclease family protein [Candidatus Limnocylindrales bacterium]
MRTILGPFHPDLENALVDEIERFKRADPMTPLLVLVPSDLMRRRLKILLSRERRLSLLNLQLLTFYQLSIRLHNERSSSPLELQDDLFLEEALRQLIRTRQPGAEPFAGIEDRVGGCAALWQTLRDLRDGLVDPTLALEALGEGHFSQRASERTTQLLVLFRTFQDFCREQNIADQSNLARYATEQLPSSQFLAQFSQVFYYGFYDLTQIQIDFFRAVARHYPTTLFFPLLAAKPGHDAWHFAENFYERYVQGHSAEPPIEGAAEPWLPASARLFDDHRDRVYSDFAKYWHCQITNTFGIHDEVSAAAKEILRLIDDGKMQFHEIGVIARSLESYGSVVKDIFHQHRIPFAGAIEEPLVQSPLAKAVILLLNLPAKDFLRSQVIDLLSTPYFKSQTKSIENASPRPDLWDLASRELAICKGAAEWRRLRNFAHRDLVLSQVSDDDEPRVIRIPRAQLVALAETVETLIADFVSLSPQASWRDYVAAWKLLLAKYLGIVPSDDATTLGAQPASAVVNDEILAILDRLAGLDAVKEQVTLEDFSHTFQHWLERSTVSEDRRNRDGVLVLTATGARGLSFRALFVLGMNEGVFPRTIREDAFLRDHDREVLERDLGYKINPKLTAFDEEKLLITLLVGAARERLYCSFQRADDSGRGLAPSWYLDELKRAVESANHKVQTVTIPRSVTEKAATKPFDRQEFLLPTELAVRLTLEGQDPTALIEALAPLPALYKQGRKVAAELDESSERLLAYDGMVGKFDNYWKRFSERGLSPTALETYARCPFQFFARHALGLAPLERPEEILGPSPAEFGELGHEILSGFYRALIENGYFAGKASTTNTESTLLAVAARAFADYQTTNPVGYPLAWESLKDGLTELLRRVIAQDLSELSKSGFVPVSLETSVTSRLPNDWPEPLNNLAIRGRMDRMDRTDHCLRVIDYKFKFGAGPLASDKNLVRAALRGERLQPPFYNLLARHWLDERTDNGPKPAIEADFYYIAPRWAEGPLLPVAYGSESLADKVGAATQQTIAYLADGIRQGRFFINRADHCAHCEVATICRKNHPPSLWRA